MTKGRFSIITQYTAIVLIACVQMWMVHHLGSEHHEVGYENHHHAHVGHDHHTHPGESTNLTPPGHSHHHHQPHPPQEHTAPFVPRKKIDSGDPHAFAAWMDVPIPHHLASQRPDAFPRPPNQRPLPHPEPTTAQPRGPPLCLS